MHNRIVQPTNDVIYIVAVVKTDGEAYTLFYDHRTRGEALRTLGRWASNPELNFTWYDAANLSQRIRANFPKTVT